MATPNLTNSITGLGGSIRDFFKGAEKVVHTKTEVPTSQEIQPHYRFDEAIDRRLLTLADYYYREGS